MEYNEKITEKIRTFVESDCVDLTNTLVINKNGECVERYSFNNVNECLDVNDKKLIVISFSGHLIQDDCCEGCASCCIDEDNGEYFCLEENGERFDCVLDMIKDSHAAYQQYLIDKKAELKE